tara:strand:- start:258 stop:485 length:228 start_codon:yes stop_codon:yes gene_type:complete
MKKIKLNKKELELIKILKIRKSDLKKKEIDFFKNFDSIDTLNAIMRLEKKFKIKINIDKIIKPSNFHALKKNLGI